MRLQKYLSAAGLCSRREAEKWIESGRVAINGRVAALGESVGEGERVTVDGKTVSLPEEHTYVLLHKPRGYVTTLSDERGRPTVAELVKDVGKRLFPVQQSYVFQNKGKGQLFTGKADINKIGRASCRERV